MAECKSWEFSSPGFTDGPRTQHCRDERSAAAFTSMGNVTIRKWTLKPRLYRGKSESIYNFHWLISVFETPSHFFAVLIYTIWIYMACCFLFVCQLGKWLIKCNVKTECTKFVSLRCLMYKPFNYCLNEFSGAFVELFCNESQFWTIVNKTAIW